MQKAFKYALIFSALFACFKLVLFLLGMQVEGKNWAVMVNIGLLPVAMFLTLAEDRKTRTYATNLMADLKTCIRTGILYTIFVSGFIFVYYNNIDPEFLSEMLDKSLATIDMNIENAPNIDGVPQHQRIENEVQSRTVFFSPKTQFIIALAGMIALSIFYAFLITFLQRAALDKYLGNKLPAPEEVEEEEIINTTEEE